MESHDGPQHNAGVYITQPTGAPQKKIASFKKVCGGIYDLPASSLV